ncbi:MAG: 50S ribosomal protein L25/general stress protein Ctc [Muribaculaceae bacterium]
MKTFNLAAAPRVGLGKKATKALRANNQIPAVINGGELVDLPYNGKLEEGQKIVEIENGKGLITTDIVVTSDAVRKLIYSPEIFAVDIELNGKNKMAILKDIQFHPVKDTVLHIDFLEVNDKKPVVIEVPVKLVGHAEGVKAGGKLGLSMRRLKVKAIYTNVPECLEINVDNLGLGQSLQVGDLHFEGLELVNAKNAVVCAVQLTRAARGAQATAE